MGSYTADDAEQQRMQKNLAILAAIDERHKQEVKARRAFRITNGELLLRDMEAEEAELEAIRAASDLWTDAGKLDHHRRYMAVIRADIAAARYETMREATVEALGKNPTIGLICQDCPKHGWDAHRATVGSAARHLLFWLHGIRGEILTARAWPFLQSELGNSSLASALTVLRETKKDRALAELRHASDLLVAVASRSVFLERLRGTADVLVLASRADEAVII